MTKKQNSSPTPDNWDKLYKVGKLGLAGASTAASLMTGIPLSTLAMNLFAFAIKPPIQKRVNSWLNDLAKRLDELEYNFANLSKNTLFVTGIMQGTQILIRNHQEEKKKL